LRANSIPVVGLRDVGDKRDEEKKGFEGLLR
jgi:hypothetical protein